MRIIVTMWVSLDGFVAGPQDEMDWLAPDDRMQDYETDLVRRADALLLGRVTHGDFAGAWPNVARDETQPPGVRAYAQRVDEMPKIVVSRSGQVTEWANSTRVASLDEAVLAELDGRFSGDVVCYGSLAVVAALREIDRVDEYHLLVHPTALGAGKPLFGPRSARANLRLLSADPLPTGVVLLRYQGGG